MIVKIHNQSNVNANGTKSNGNCKPVYCITTGMIYASVADCAKDLDVNQSTVSYALLGKLRTVKGKRVCFLSKITEHFDEITKCVTEINIKASHYDAIVERQNAKQRAYDTLAARKQSVAKLQEKLNHELYLLAEAEATVAQYNQ